ncbi:hypothetical protein RV11_GL001833 [Enterococcus phoeniculicola]|jgi:hypothetical protein|nr:hypothetical protein RV11_GL001833 [Enterococcus phoeniculicola]
MVILGLLSTILIRYTITSSIVYFYMFFLILSILTTIILKKIETKKKNIYLIILASFIACYTIVISTSEIDYVLKRYMIFYLVLIYCLIKFVQLDYFFAEKTYYSLSIMLNIFSVANLYQTIFKVPLLKDYMDLIETGFYYHFGESSFRTMSVFNHPIISGLFFIFLFFINFYTIKKKSIMIILQSLAILNIYTSQSRSSWLAFIFVCVLYITINKKDILKNLFKLNVPLSLHIIRFSLLLLFIAFIFLFGESVVASVIKRFGDSLSLNSTSGSNLQRLSTMNLILNHMFSQNLIRIFLGFGGGTVSLFMLNNPILIDNFSTPDNHYLTLFYEFGIIGLLFYISLILYIIYKFYSKKNRHWTVNLSFLCFMTINFEFIFFEAWPVVLVMLAFLIAHLLFNFKEDQNMVIHIN